MSWKKINKEALGNGIAGCLLVVAFFGSLTQIRRTAQEVFDPTKKTISIAHWQLELGYRDALDKVCREYEKLHPDVKIRQVAVSEKFYGQVVNTHLVSGTAPDLIEMGFSTMVQMDQYLARYFEPMSGHIQYPNPYNNGTELEGVRWQDTFIDGMQSWYREALQEYYGIPSSAFTVRVFYNKDMFQKIVGHDRPPKTFGEFMNICEKIETSAKQEKTTLVPIAGSLYNSRIFFERYLNAFGSRYEPALDFGYDGGITGYRMYLGLRQGKLKWDDPTNKAAFELLHELSQHFQPGFMAVGREQAAFLFVQEQAAMITSGSWDAESLFRQARFKVGIFDFPMPAKDEKYGQYVRGRQSEAGTGTGGGFGLYRLSKQKEVALDFLKFFSSKRINQQFNQDITWIPVVVGTQPKENLKVFAPDPVGYASSFTWVWGSHSDEVYMGGLTQYLQNEISFDQFGKTILDALNDKTYGWYKAATLDYESMRNTVTMQEQLLGIVLSDHLFPKAIGNFDQKYREVLIRQTKMAQAQEEYRDRLQKGLSTTLEVK